jgi:hypothetical protein
MLLILLSLFILVLYSNNVFLSRMLYYLAILDIDIEIEYLRIAKNYLYILVRIVYYIRILFIEVLLSTI